MGKIQFNTIGLDKKPKDCHVVVAMWKDGIPLVEGEDLLAEGQPGRRSVSLLEVETQAGL